MIRKKRQFKRKPEREVKVWNPCTELGHNVKSERIDSLDTIWKQGKIIKEPEIVDFFLTDLEERVLKIGKGKRPFRWVQRMTDSGRRSKYVVVAAVGNKNGYVGLGIGRGKAYGSAINSALRKAKLGIIKVERGCGSWDCGCSETHSIPTETTGKVGSITLKLKPAPQGTGLSVNDISKDILELAGVKDVWSFSRGHTATRRNMSKATFAALKNLSRIKLLKPRIEKKRVMPKPTAEKPSAEKQEKEETEVNKSKNE